MNNFELSEIEILPIKPRDGLVAFCSFVVNGALFIGDVGIHLRPDGDNIRLVFPSRRANSGISASCVHPINRQTGDVITQAVAKRYKSLLKKSGEKYDQRPQPTKG